jgi:ATP-dependent helicase HrpB
MLTSLPIDALLPRILEVLRAGKNLVLEAEPGAGKTTRVPRALLDGGLLEKGECWVLEPRRLAARLAAARVADELGEELGRRVGYAVRFEQKVSKETRIRFVTEGLLLRRLQEDPRLKGIAVVILDEFHERHLHTDLAITLLRRLQKERTDLRLLVMSATLDAEPVAAYLEAERLRCEGRAFPVETRHAPRPDDRPLGVKVAEALERVAAEGRRGHTLVFLPGAAEIRQCLSSCEPFAQRIGAQLLPLHGSLSFEAQKAAVAPSSHPKIILSTNVAESSVTVEGVTTILDSGLGREAVHSPWSGLSGLRTARISQARCVQRAGRAGRTAPGLCLRLFTEAEFAARPAFDVPELQRSDLAEAVMSLSASGVRDLSSLDWFEAPPAQALESATRLLRRLGALDGDGHITARGRAMAALPLHPRLARLVVAGDEMGIPHLARLAAALLETGDLSARSSLDRRRNTPGHGLESDLWVRLDAYQEVEAAHFGAGACRAAGLDPATVQQARQVFRALGGQASSQEPADAEERLLQALLAAYPDRVAKSGGSATYALLGGGGAKLDPSSRVGRADLILALEVDESTQGTGRQVLIRMGSRLEPEWILEAFPSAIRETLEFSFNASKGQVERRSGIWYEDLCLDESRRVASADEPGVAQCLARAALQKGLGNQQEAVDHLLDRAAFLAKHRSDLELPDRPLLLEALVTKACEGCRSLKGLEIVDWNWTLRELIGADAARLLETWAPEIVLLRKRKVKVNYGGETPWIESRLQDFLGVKEGPRIAGGAVPLVLHLLAPNNRAVQVTTDLAGFWQRTYQEIRPGLSRRYPKHLWPEDPGKG